jgi:hypothetical protein
MIGGSGLRFGTPDETKLVSFEVGPDEPVVVVLRHRLFGYPTTPESLDARGGLVQVLTDTSR